MRFSGKSLPLSEIRAALAQVDQAAASAATEGLYPLYATLHRTAAIFGPVDAFYVCLYQPGAERLHFVYNFDADLLDDPLTIPLGEGPTSFVVRNNRPFILREEEGRSVQDDGISFGDRQRVSLSAVHVAMCLPPPPPGEEEQVIGVVSAQSYQSRAYDDSYTDVLQMLADRVAVAIQRTREQDTWRGQQAQWERQMAEQQQQIEAVSEASVRALFTLGKEIEALRPLLPADHSALMEALERLRRSCHQLQTALHQQRVTPLRSSPLPLAPVAERVAVGTSSAHAGQEPVLTERERETLRLLSSGASNRKIADALGVSVNTIRFHLKNLYVKLGVQDRAHCIRKAVDIFPLE